jgi:hypothetical protein
VGEPVKQLQLTSSEQLVLPDSLDRTIKNYRSANYGYDLDQRDEDYIEYHTLRQKVQDTEEITISKIVRLYDRDSEDQFIIYYQSSRVKDFNNNIRRCPIVELIGVVPKPISNISNDSGNRITDIRIVETQNEYTLPYSQDKLIELFELSKERHKIVCYAGYTRPTRIKPYDLIDGKKIIWNQERFVNGTFNELMDKEKDNQDILDTKRSYVIPNKIREIRQQPNTPLLNTTELNQNPNITRSKRVELSEIANDVKAFKLKKTATNLDSNNITSTNNLSYTNTSNIVKDPTLVDADKEFQELQASTNTNSNDNLNKSKYNQKEDL